MAAASRAGGCRGAGGSLDPGRPRGALPAVRRADHRLCGTRLHVQFRGGARARCRRRRYGQYARPRGCSSRRSPPLPGITIAERGNDLGAAASAIRAGRAIAAVYLPPEFAKDLLAAERPARRVHQHPVLHAGQQRRQEPSRRDQRPPARRSRRRRRRQRTPASRAGPRARGVCASNPALNYAQFLLRAVLPTVLHVVIAISAGYAVGSEFRRRSMRAWWDRPAAASPRRWSASCCRTTSC